MVVGGERVTKGGRGRRQGEPCQMVHHVLVHVKDLRCYFKFKGKLSKGFKQRNK